MAAGCGGGVTLTNTTSLSFEVPLRSRTMAIPKLSPFPLWRCCPDCVPFLLVPSSRGDRTWDLSTFRPNNKITETTPISAAVVVRMDPDTGAVLSSFGSNFFYMPHMITFDREGNLWITDVGLHQVKI